MDMDMVDVDMVDVDMVNWKFGKFHIFGKFTKDHLADLSRLLGLVCLFVLVMVAAGRWKGCGGGAEEWQEFCGLVENHYSRSLMLCKAES